MDFTVMGSVNKYMKNFKLQAKWEHKKATGNFENDEYKTPLQRKNEQFKQSYMEQQKDNENDSTLSAIYTKIEMGSKLTSEEMKYLQTKNPAAYQKIKNLETEKVQYEKDLKKCKTKEDVEKLKMSKISSSLSAISSVKNNPNIPKGKKLEVCIEEQRRMSSLAKITNKFVNSEEYKNLPTESEKRKAEQEISIAEKNEKIETINREADIPENADNESLQEKSENVEITEYENEASDVKNVEKPKSRTEAEQTPEAKKLKRSKAKKSYVITSDNSGSEAAVSVFSEKA
ncbi:MAG: hypothetical protein ACI4I9_02000 [Porcipelethomonas sp.]